MIRLASIKIESIQKLEHDFFQNGGPTISFHHKKEFWSKISKNLLGIVTISPKIFKLKRNKTKIRNIAF